MVRALYALAYYQIVCQFCAGASAEGRAALAAVGGPSASGASGASGEPHTLRQAARVLLQALAGSDLFTEDGPPQPGAADEPPDIAGMEEQVGIHAGRF